LAAPYNTPVKAVAHGMIIEVRRGGRGFGNTVLLSHPNKTGKCKITTRYAHLSRIDERIKVGDMVEQGQTIGRVGNTGHVQGRNGMHLHIEVAIYGKRVDPLYFFQHVRSMR
jgi:murein DD-endopeptidase MepM/ murein hydrolase activator NlpD